MLNLGFSEILFIAMIALIFIGPKQLPEVARTLGRFLNELKRSSGALFDDIKMEARRTDYENQIKPPEPEKPKTETVSAPDDKKIKKEDQPS